MIERREYEMTEDDLSQIIKACKSVPLIALQCGTPKSPQANANDAWNGLGKRMGFDGATVEPTSKGNRFFTAVPIEAEKCGIKEEIQKVELTGMEKIERLTDAARPMIKYLNENHHPHTKVIVDSTSVELLESSISNPEILDYLRD